jgi:hypothetical protein
MEAMVAFSFASGLMVKKINHWARYVKFGKKTVHMHIGILSKQELRVLLRNLQSVESQLAFQRNMSPPSLGLKSKPNKKLAGSLLTACYCWFLAWLTLRLCR